MPRGLPAGWKGKQGLDQSQGGPPVFLREAGTIAGDQLMFTKPGTQFRDLSAALDKAPNKAQERQISTEQKLKRPLFGGRLGPFKAVLLRSGKAGGGAGGTQPAADPTVVRASFLLLRGAGRRRWEDGLPRRDPGEPRGPRQWAPERHLSEQPGWGRGNSTDPLRALLLRQVPRALNVF